MKYFRAFLAALGMFTAIPMPQLDWDMEHGSRMTACLGFVGAVLGALYLGLSKLIALLPVPAPLFAVLFVAAAYLLTGLLHLDGFMDVCDAVLSRRDLPERQRILKDSHCGAFAVICVCLLTLAQWVMFFSAKKPALLPLAMLPVVTRGCAGLAVLSLRPMQSSQYAKARTKSVSARVVLYILLTAALALPFVIDGWRGLAGLAAAGVYWLAALSAKRQLGGMSGDVSGFALCLAEFAGAAILCLWR